jgi:Skp family chaperone for outer membrane proteins
VKCTCKYLATLTGLGMMLVLACSVQAQGQPAPAGNQPTPPPNHPTIAVFNMAAVMREYHKAKFQTYVLNEEKKKRSVDLVAKQGEYVKLKTEVQIQKDPTTRDQMQLRMLALQRQIEDLEREINKQMNSKVSDVISTLYDEIKSVVDRTAEMNGYLIVFAYPDAVGDDMKNPYMKELKLKPSAAQPFYVARQVDITQVVIQALNSWYPSQLPPDPTTQAPTSQPPPTQVAPQTPAIPGGPNHP